MGMYLFEKKPPVAQRVVWGPVVEPEPAQVFPPQAQSTGAVSTPRAKSSRPPVAKRISSESHPRRRHGRGHCASEESDEYHEVEEEELVRGIQEQRKAIEGDSEASTRAYDLLKSAHEKYPNNAVVQAYLASALALLGRDAADPMERLSKANEALKMIDDSVSRAPDNVQVRATRAYVCAGLPEEFFHRNATAVEDFRHLLAMYERDSRAFAEDFYLRLLFDLGKSLRALGRESEAMDTWDKLLAISGDSQYGTMVRSEKGESN